MSRPFFDRYCKVIITDETNHTSLDVTGLNVKFEVSRYIDSPLCEAKISILGLSKNTIDSLVAIEETEKARKKRKRITIYGGYKANPFVVFSGYIVYAVPTQPPDMWLEITAWNYYSVYDGNYSISVTEETTLRELLTTASRKIGLDGRIFVDKLIEDKKIKSFHSSGSLEHIIGDLKSATRTYIFIDGGRLCAYSRAKFDASNPSEISLRYGLVGLSEVNYYGFQATMLMDNRIALNNAIELKSELVPMSNGKGRVYMISHKGDFRGKEWYTIVQAFRQLENK